MSHIGEKADIYYSIYSFGRRDGETRAALKRAINECFVSGFRRVMLVGAVLALTSSLIAWLLIRSK